MNGGDVNDILIFLSVVDAASFTAGSRAHGLSRSAAGKAVARLEARFNMRLLNRSTRAIALTDEGGDLYERGLAIRAVLDDAERDLSPRTREPRGVLRLTVPDAFGRQQVLPLLPRFLADWPDVQVEMSFSDNVASFVDQGFDLAIRIGVSEPSPGLTMRMLRHEAVLLCAAPSYLRSREAPASIEQLSTHDLLFHAHGNERQTWSLTDETGALVAARGKSRLRLDNGAALHQAALDGLGIALLPAFLVTADIAEGRLSQILPESTPSRVPIMALYPHKRHLEGKVRFFVDMLAAAGT